MNADTTYLAGRVAGENEASFVWANDSDEVMFPKGIRQMFAYCFAMEGRPAYARSGHAKMIDMVNDGYAEHSPVGGVNMREYTALEKRAECAKICETIRKLLNDETAYQLLCAKYSPTGLHSKIAGMNTLCRIAFEHLNSGRFSARRGHKYIADLVAYVCIPAEAGRRSSVMAISKRYGLGHDLISRDIARVKKIIYRYEAAIIAKIEEVFARGRIVPGNDYPH